MKTGSDPLPCELVSRKDLSDGMIVRMHELMEICYDHVSSDRFREDLARKDWVLVLTDFTGQIQGFSTLSLNPRGLGESGRDVLYSGDTVIHPGHWGGQSLVRGFFHAAGSILSNCENPLYWYLLSKGHRTYMYLPLLFKRYYPALEPSREFPMGSSLATFFSERLFPGCWEPNRGVIHFPESQGQVNTDLAEDTRSRRGHSQVDFFMERNPGFAEGDELVCVAELSPDNLRRPSSRAWMEAGMRGEPVGKGVCIG